MLFAYKIREKDTLSRQGLTYKPFRTFLRPAPGGSICPILFLLEEGENDLTKPPEAIHAARNRPAEGVDRAAGRSIG